MDPYELFLEGRELEAQAASALEREVAANPSRVEARARLLGFYGKGASRSASMRKRFCAHNLWFIQNAPESPVCGVPILDLPPGSNRAFYKRARGLWLGHCRRETASPVLLAHAARFFIWLDRKMAQKLLERGEAIEPRRTHWKKQLAHLHDISSQHGSAGRRRAAARAALRKYEEVRRLTPDRNFRFYGLPALARAALSAGDLRKAKKYATEAIAEAVVFRDWAHGNGIHHGNLVLGRLALVRGKLSLASKHLLEAGRTSGSPQLNSFGPSFDLAAELLRAGAQASVLSYLELCRVFWPVGAQALDAWSAQIRRGKRPDFQAAWKDGSAYASRTKGRATRK